MAERGRGGRFNQNNGHGFNGLISTLILSRRARSEETQSNHPGETIKPAGAVHRHAKMEEQNYRSQTQMFQ